MFKYLACLIKEAGFSIVQDVHTTPTGTLFWHIRCTWCLWCTLYMVYIVYMVHGIHGIQGVQHRKCLVKPHFSSNSPRCTVSF